ncbi:MAG: LPS assembly protein LptD [Woeseiaceae bacterium]
MKSYIKTTLVIGLAFLASYPAYSYAQDVALCRVQPASVIHAETFSKDDKTHLQSDSVQYIEKEISVFKGNVIIKDKLKRIEADYAEYNKETERVTAKGNVSLISNSIKIKSQSAHFNLKTDQASFNKPHYQSVKTRARGQAKKINVINSDVTELIDATYTTCDPNDADWLLSSNNITLDNASHQGYASHVVLRFKGVPFFYFPYFRFPLGEERLSGFLFPDFGISDTNGDELKLPYYWNIHPQIDATITPWYMSKRGTLLDTEIRYLTENNNGSIKAEFLNNDKIFKDNRKRLQWKHQSTPALGWQANAEYNEVADNQHFIDFSRNLTNTSTTYLIRTANASYNHQNWLLNIKAEDHQILSGANPYKRLPQVTLNSRYPVRSNQLNYSLQTEAVHFEHEDNKVFGTRLHIKPTLTYPMKSAAGFIQPTLSIQHTQYNLKNNSTGEENLSRTIPTFSVNSGLFFERDTQFFDQNYLQTLEPQLFYVYVPFEEQSHLPIFDTSAYAFNINQSFVDYRFNGIDRIGDDNRITAALATRFINQENGQENFMARIGQIYYLSDRKVQLNSTSTISSSQSNIIAEVKAKVNNWNISTQQEWDPIQKETVISSDQLGFQYRKFKLNLARRFQLNTLETQETKMNWALNSRWQFEASSLFDVKNDHVVDSLFGINYESCCWGLRMTLSERYLTATTQDTRLYLTLTLKGLGGFGVKKSLNK